MSVPRIAAGAATALGLLALVAGPAPAEIWSAAPEPTFFTEAGEDPPDQPPDRPTDPVDPLASCDWPEPDPDLAVPDPEDYLIPQEDGSLLLPNETVEVGGQDVSLAELQDMLTIAEHRGISPHEALLRFGWQGEFGEVVQRLQARFPDQLADSRLLDDGCRGQIAFKDAVPDLAVSLVRTLPAPVALIGDRGYHEQELVDVLHASYFPISDHPEVAMASGGPDGATGVVTIRAQPHGETTSADRAALCRELLPPAPANPAITLRLILVEDLSAAASRTHTC